MRKQLKSGYHHGDLRQALIQSAIDLINEKGITGISLREAARVAGVSHNAPYRHFPDKQSLLAAIADEGFLGLRRKMIEAGADRTDDSLKAILAMGTAYILFAIQNPAQFRVMFWSEGTRRPDCPETRAAKAAIFEMVVKAVVGCQEKDIVGPVDVRAYAIAAWATVHGLANLMLDGALSWVGLDVDDNELLIQQVSEVIAYAMDHRP